MICMINIPVQYVSVLVCVYLVDDVDSVLQQESCSLPLVVGVGVLSELLDPLFSRLTEQHLNTTQTHYDTDLNTDHTQNLRPKLIIQ